MTRETTAAIDRDELVQRYVSGETIVSLATHYDVSRHTLTKVLRQHTDLRSMSEVQFLINSKRSAAERRRIVAAAHAAKRGRPNPRASRGRGALMREVTPTITDTEAQLAAWMADRGEQVAHQRAIGTYKLYLAVPPVAVEILGGNWHNNGRDRERMDYILDQGWTLCLVWDQVRCPLGVEAADYVVALLEQSRRDPSLASEYRVIRGDGEQIGRGRGKLDDFALVPSQRRAGNRRS